MNKILIANRGEIAVRIIRACKEMNIKTVAVYSEIDKNALHTKLADEAICIGPANPKQSYLNIKNIIEAARITKADSIHPGFGFLSENANFAKICEESNIKFIGPTSRVINLLGNKSNSKELMKREDVPVIPGSEGSITGLKEATGNITQASKTMDLTDGKIDMYSGEDAVILPLLAIGAAGVISVWSNVAPADVHNLCQSFFDGDLETARRLQRKGLALIDALFSEVSPIPVKKAMNLMGMEVGPLRAPLCEMTEAGTTKLAEVMKAYGLL